MTNQKIAWISAAWHAAIVNQALHGARPMLAEAKVEIEAHTVPGAFEIPLLAKRLARTGRLDAVVGAALVVDGGIYRHDFVANTVVNALMQVGLETDVPTLSVVLTPHHFQPTPEHQAFFSEHFVKKGEEAARAVLALRDTRAA